MSIIDTIFNSLPITKAQYYEPSQKK